MAYDADIFLELTRGTPSELEQKVADGELDFVSIHRIAFRTSSASNPLLQRF
jgi:hypothetical protein